MSAIRLGCWLAILAAILVAAMLCYGCSLLKVQTSQPSHLPALVQPSEGLLEAERQADDFAIKATGLVYHKGAPPEAPLVGQVRDVLEAGRTRTGLPTEALRSPQRVDAPDKGAAGLIKRLGRLNATQRADEATWAENYEAARGEGTKGGFLVGVVGWLGSTTFWLLLALVILCPGLLKVVTFLVGRYKATRKALEEVIGGVQAVVNHRGLMDDGEADAVKEVLIAHRSPETQAEIRATKIRLGLPVNPKEVKP
jgi:hypothetical protein